MNDYKTNTNIYTKQIYDFNKKKTTKLKIEKIIKNIQTKITKCLVFIVHLKPYLNVIDINFPTIN